MVEKVPDDEPQEEAPKTQQPKEKEKARVNLRMVETDDHFNEYPLDDVYGSQANYRKLKPTEFLEKPTWKPYLRRKKE